MPTKQSRTKIALNDQSFFSQRGVTLPDSLWREPPYLFKPQDFTVEDSRLAARQMTEEVQVESLRRFVENPAYPAVYGVGSSPADNKAKLFAAYLLQQYLEVYSGDGVIWENLNVLMTRHSSVRNSEPAFLVVTNVFPGTSLQRMEKLRDLLEMYENIPRIVVVAGCDPFSFVTGRLGFRLDNVFYYTAAGAKVV